MNFGYGKERVREWRQFGPNNVPNDTDSLGLALQGRKFGLVGAVISFHLHAQAEGQVETPVGSTQ